MAMRSIDEIYKFVKVSLYQELTKLFEGNIKQIEFYFKNAQLPSNTLILIDEDTLSISHAKIRESRDLLISGFISQSEFERHIKLEIESLILSLRREIASYNFEEFSVLYEHALDLANCVHSYDKKKERINDMSMNLFEKRAHEMGISDISIKKILNADLNDLELIARYLSELDYEHIINYSKPATSEELLENFKYVFERLRAINPEYYINEYKGDHNSLLRSYEGERIRLIIPQEKAKFIKNKDISVIIDSILNI